MRVVDAQTRVDDAGRCKGHGHSMVFVSVDGFSTWFASFAVPKEDGIVGFMEDLAQLSHFTDKCRYAIGFLDFQAFQASETERGVL